MTDFAAIGLPNESPFNWRAPITKPKPRNRSVRPTRAESVLIKLMSDDERRARRKELILRVNKSVDLGAHGGLSKGQKAAR